jgi:hypothetical protein
MEHIQIKYYGLFPITKSTYLVTTLFVCTAMVVLIALCLLVGIFPPLALPWEQEPVIKEPGLGPWIANHIYWIILIGLILEALDIAVVLRCFARKEAEQRARLAKLQSSDLTP